MGRPPLGQSSDRIATGRAPTKRALIGTRIRERRLSQGWRQTEVARRAEISAAYLNLIEHNRRPVSEALLGRLAQALHIDVTELASDHEEALISGLREAAGRLSDHKHPLELDQIAEFAARYPGWASALSVAIHRADALAQPG